MTPISMIVFLLTALMPGDWPQFRGPDSNGHVSESRVPVEWSDSKNVTWRVALPGLGWSSPSIVNDRIYLTTAVPKGEGLSLRALCLSTEDGTIIWDQEVRAIDKVPSIHTKNSHASPTPIVDGGSVYVHFGTLGTARLDAGSGEIVWLTTQLEYNPLHGSGGSPVLYNGRLFVACDGTSQPYVAAIDAATGEIAWKTPRSIEAKISHSFGTATIVMVDGQAQVVLPGPDHLGFYNPETGEEIARVRAHGWSVVPQPAVGHGLVIYNHDYDHPELIAVRLGGVGDVTESHIAWRIDRGAPSTPSPLIAGDELYFVSDNGIASCVDAKTGERHWMERLGGNFSSSPVFTNGRILFMNETGTATWIAAGKEFRKLNENQLSGRTFATPAFSGGAMFLRTDEYLYRFEDQTQK